MTARKYEVALASSRVGNVTWTDETWWRIRPAPLGLAARDRFASSRNAVIAKGPRASPTSVRSTPSSVNSAASCSERPESA